jgi:hypothetical protein
MGSRGGREGCCHSALHTAIRLEQTRTEVLSRSDGRPFPPISLKRESRKTRSLREPWELGQNRLCLMNRLTFIYSQTTIACTSSVQGVPYPTTTHTHAHYTHADTTKSSNFRSVGLHPSSPSLQSKESELEPLMSQTDRVVFLQHPRFQTLFSPSQYPVAFQEDKIPDTPRRHDHSTSPPERPCQTLTTHDRDFFVYVMSA